MSKIESAVQWALEIASDDTHGYSQSVRWGPSYDCSSLVISAWEQAGVPVKTCGATFTGNMYQIFKNNGFADVTALCNLPTGTGFQRGDVLLNDESHTAMYIGNGQIVHARSSEGTSDTADNTGNEIRVQSYWNFPWDHILRYGEVPTVSESTATTNTVTVISSSNTENDILLPDNSTGKGVAMLQGILKMLKYNLGWCGIDGDAGTQNSYTNIALRSAYANGDITDEMIEAAKQFID